MISSFHWKATCEAVQRQKGFPGGSNSKESACNAGDTGSIPGWGRSPGEGHGNPLQYSCQRIPWTEEPGRVQSMKSKRAGHGKNSTFWWIFFLSIFSEVSSTSKIDKNFLNTHSPFGWGCMDSVMSDSVTYGLQPTRLLCSWISQAKKTSGLPFPSPGDLPDPGIESSLLYWQLDSLPLSHQGSPLF